MKKNKKIKVKINKLFSYAFFQAHFIYYPLLYKD